NKNGKLKINGIKGLERSYNDELNQVRDGVLKGERDVLSYIIFNKDSIIKTRRDGKGLKLNISLKLQKNIEIILDQYKEKLGADEIIVSIMDSVTGKVLSLASSNRFNPKHIKLSDYPNLNVNAIENVFEPGSVLKPISISLVLDKHRATLDELIYAHNKGKRNKDGEYKEGKMKVGRWYIRDDHKFKKNYLTIQDIVIYSSNIGTLQLAQRLKGAEILEGYQRFGITKKTGIDLPYEKVGTMPSVYQLRAGEDKGKDNVFKATVSYGQGMTSSFMQILKAYTVFNNDGKIITPMIVQKELTHQPIQVISKSTANIMKRLLIKTVKDGTAKKAIYDGLEIGGKTGTANIARGGKYKRKYMSSFFGFVNDKNRRFTIGVTVNNPISTGKYWYYYYASNSAVPIFKEMVDILVKLNYLEPNVAIISKNN
ncbi:MAG: penicillin-binding protein 2, partial [Arcobacteraceae bacterium]|nr:penicillin-binding protein 2 [Arcobacteraceae bacterium]